MLDSRTFIFSLFVAVFAVEFKTNAGGATFLR